jgi:hypothetical protein
VVVSVNPLPTATISPNGPLNVCNSQPIILTSSVGSAYLWSPGNFTTQSISVNSAGNYSVTVTDAQGCQGTSPVTVVNANSSVSPSFSQIAPICSGSSFSIPTTSTNGITGIWSPAPNNQATTIYSFTPNPGQCAVSTVMQVTVNPLPSISAGPDQTVCAGEQMTLNGVGGNTYTWNNNVTNGIPFNALNSGTYIVSGTNATTGCSNTDQMVLTVLPSPTVNAGADQVVCSGDSIVLSATGSAPITWSNGVSNGVEFIPFMSQLYTVTATETNGCTASDDVLVTVNESTSSTLNETALDVYTLNGQTYTQSGTYTQVIPNAAGCDSTITLNLTLSYTGLNETVDGIYIYPNPTNKDLIIMGLNTEFVNFQIFDAVGRQVSHGSINKIADRIHVQDLADGSYSIVIEGMNIVKRFIKH